MTAKICDRCHKTYTQFTRAAVYRWFGKNDQRWHEPDLCPACQEDLMRWFITIPKEVPKTEELPQIFDPFNDGFVFEIDDLKEGE